MGTAAAITATVVLVVEKEEMMRVLHTERALSDRFMSYILSRNIRIEEDLVDQLLTPARSGWLAPFCSSLALAKTRNRKERFLKYPRRCWRE